MVGGIIFILLGIMFEVMGLVPLVTSLIALRAGRGLPGASSLPADSAPGQDDPFSAAGLFGSMAATDRGSSPDRQAGTGMVDAIERLTALHQQGNLSDDEFVAAKRALIEGRS